MPFITLPLLDEALNIQSTPYWVDDGIPEDVEYTVGAWKQGSGIYNSFYGKKHTKETKALWKKNRTAWNKGKRGLQKDTPKVTSKKHIRRTCTKCGKTMNNANIFRWGHSL